MSPTPEQAQEACREASRMLVELDKRWRLEHNAARWHLGDQLAILTAFVESHLSPPSAAAVPSGKPAMPHEPCKKCGLYGYEVLYDGLCRPCAEAAQPKAPSPSDDVTEQQSQGGQCINCGATT